uniref:Uncharacterized protein n=1 Tax=Tanacetum cinerariifolium TaxID=118510 RepID=A0A6L2J8V2_TANCI|nr:hypothetical protein [Tanacetum cinerariifolium]
MKFKPLDTAAVLEPRVTGEGASRVQIIRRVPTQVKNCTILIRFFTASFKTLEAHSAAIDVIYMVLWDFLIRRTHIPKLRA